VITMRARMHAQWVSISLAVASGWSSSCRRGSTVAARGCVAILRAAQFMRILDVVTINGALPVRR
jgi:hypothetical protein